MSAKTSQSHLSTSISETPPHNKIRLVWAAISVALLLVGAAAYLFRSRSREGGISSVAVLPFVNASNDTNSEYLSDGITESLINNLSQLPNLTVMSRASVFHYKAREVDPQIVGKDLKVQAVVTGRIVQHGDRLMISSELIDARTNRNLWGEQYDRSFSDLLAVQQDITSAISARLRERLSGESKKPLVSKGGTNDPEAYQVYLEGRFYWRVNMNYFFCGLVEVRGLQDALGTTCGRSAGTLCYDCGTSLCVNHTQHCELCRENFYPSCLSFHLNEHSKPAERDKRRQQTRRTA